MKVKWLRIKFTV